MRVLHVMADGRAGGGPTVVLTLCEQMRREGIEVGVATAANTYLHQRCQALGMPVFEMDFSRRTATWKLRGGLERVAREFGANVVHAHGARSALPVALIARRKRPPLVYTVHGFHHSAKGWPARSAGRLAEKLCIARAAATIFVSKGDQSLAQREGLRSRGPQQVIYNGVAVPGGLRTPVGERTFDLAFVARLHRQKDPLILPEILAAIRPAKPSLLIVGGGELEGALRSKITEMGVADQVTLLGAMPRDDALAMLAKARVFLLPSLWEGLPVSLAEAMRLEVAIVASDVAGNNEIVSDGNTGLLAPVGNARAFAAAIDRLLENDTLYVGLTARAAAFVDKTFSPERQCAEHVSLYRSLIG